MKSTGITKKIDQLGRIVIPKEIRSSINIKTNDYLELYTEGDFLIVKKSNKNCALCGNVENIVTLKNINICKECIKYIKRIEL